MVRFRPYDGWQRVCHFMQEVKTLVEKTRPIRLKITKMEVVEKPLKQP